MQQWLGELWDGSSYGEHVISALAVIVFGIVLFTAIKIGGV